MIQLKQDIIDSTEEIRSPARLRAVRKIGWSVRVSPFAFTCSCDTIKGNEAVVKEKEILEIVVWLGFCRDKSLQSDNCGRKQALCAAIRCVSS